MDKYNFINSINRLGINLLNSNNNQLSPNIINFQNYKFEINLPVNLNFLFLSKLFSEKIIIELSNFLKIPIFFPQTNTIIQDNWLKSINSNQTIIFFLSKYVNYINQNNNTKEKVIKKNTPKKQNKPRKKAIPVALKRKVWAHWIGEDIGKTKCPCCKLTDITQLNFSCGHIVAEANGGTLHVSNLRPICVSCNSSMGTKNMNEFIKEYGL